MLDYPDVGPTRVEPYTGIETTTGPAAGVKFDAGGSSRLMPVILPSVPSSISGFPSLTTWRSPIGGGLYNEGTTTLTECTVSGNSAAHGGGGVSNYGSLALTNCTVSGNSATEGGGGVGTGSFYYRGATTTLTNCTVSGNSAGGFGGGLDNYGTTTLTNCTVA